jgi:Lauroyl/myristoyl acyltransferase
MRVLFVVSDAFYILIFYVFGYRKKVVLDNLKMAFPDKSDTERQQICKHFFKHLIDLMVESIKSFSISEKEILKRYTFNNPELIKNYAKQGKSIMLVGAHQANWEWSISLPKTVDINLYGAYTRLSNPYFDKKIRQSREKFGGTLIRGSKMIKQIDTNYKTNIQGGYVLLSDQSPQLKKAYYWRTFLGIKVPVHTGAEMLAKKYDLVVIYYSAKKVKRGYYEVDLKLITDQPKTFEDYKITDAYTRLQNKN